MNEPKVNLFYSYSHKDESLRDALETHLSILKRQGLLSDWHDRKIIAGKDWEREIDAYMTAADIILLLVSPDMIASDYCYGKELSKALERHESGHTMVVPVIARPVDWASMPFAKFQALPRDGKPVTSWGNIDEAWLDVEMGLRRTIEKITTEKASSSSHQAKPERLKDLIMPEFVRIENAYEGMKKFSGASTGFNDLDKIIDGIHPGDILLVASRPSMGKTDFALNVAQQFAIGSGSTVVYFSLRKAQDHVLRRLLSSQGKVQNSKLVRGFLRESDWPKISLAAGTLAEAPIFIDGTSNLTDTDLTSRIDGLKDNKLGLIIIDGIEHISSEKNHSTRNTEVTSIISAIKNLARQQKIPIIITANTSRESDLRRDKRPILRDLAEWEMFASDIANVVIFLYRDEIYNIDSPDKGTTEIIVAKNDYGPINVVRVKYYSEYCSFENIEDTNKRVE